MMIFGYSVLWNSIRSVYPFKYRPSAVLCFCLPALMADYSSALQVAAPSKWFRWLDLPLSVHVLSYQYVRGPSPRTANKISRCGRDVSIPPSKPVDLLLLIEADRTETAAGKVIDIVRSSNHDFSTHFVRLVFRTVVAVILFWIEGSCKPCGVPHPPLNDNRPAVYTWLFFRSVPAAAQPGLQYDVRK